MIHRKQLGSGPEWMDLKSIQGYADVSHRTLREWIHRPQNPLPASQVERGKLLINRSTFDRWLEGHPMQSTGSIDANQVADEMLKQFEEAA